MTIEDHNRQLIAQIPVRIIEPTESRFLIREHYQKVQDFKERNGWSSKFSILRQFARVRNNVRTVMCDGKGGGR